MYIYISIFQGEYLGVITMPYMCYICVEMLKRDIYIYINCVKARNWISIKEEPKWTLDKGVHLD